MIRNYPNLQGYNVPVIFVAVFICKTNCIKWIYLTLHNLTEVQKISNEKVIVILIVLSGIIKSTASVGENDTSTSSGASALDGLPPLIIAIVVVVLLVLIVLIIVLVWFLRRYVIKSTVL